MATVGDIATNGNPPPEAPSPRKLGGYRNYVTKQRNIIYSNAKAYINKRTESPRFSDAKLRKVFKGATYIQAHPERYQSGQFNVEFMKYFVVHRPGINPKACTLLNTLRTFTGFADGRKASTHFVIGLNGELIQMVDLADRSQHCGTDPKKGAKVFNSNSVGVELEGAIFERFTIQQYRTLASVIRKLHDLSNFLGDINSSTFVADAKSKIFGHQEIKSDKGDPGFNFNYGFLTHLIREIPATSKNSIFRAPLDPLFSIETSLQEVVTQAQDPGSAGEAALLGGTTQDALAMQRAMIMSFMGRTEMAYAAATTAQRQAAFMDRKMADIQHRIGMMGLTWAPVPSPETNYQTYIDYLGAMGTYVVKKKKKKKVS